MAFKVRDEDLEPYRLEHSDRVIMAHPQKSCTYDVGPCTIHLKTNHKMRAFPQHWRDDRGIMERICPHGIGHPDPDDLRVRTIKHEGVHGCDGCCCG